MAMSALPHERPLQMQASTSAKCQTRTLVHRSLGQEIYQLWAMVCLGGSRSAPERTGIGSVSMKLHHPVEEFAHGRGFLVEAHEVSEVTARFLDDPRMVVVLGPFVAGDHGAGFQRFELVEGGDPFEPG